jgi:hypothetical protein
MKKIHESGTGEVRSRFKRGAITQACAAAIALAGAGHTVSASAGVFSLDNGVEGYWSLGTSLGTNWRARDADPALISAGNGGRGGDGNDDGNLNYRKGSVFSTTAKVSGEVTLKKGNLGAVIGAKGWYDYTAKNKNVAHGSFANGHAPGATLDDSGFDLLSKFSGVALGNAYVFGTLNLAEGTPLNVKLGNHVVNWGESLFISGINQFGAFDLPAFNRPGAQVKDLLLPIPQLSATLALQNGVILEGFYQFKWKKNIVDGCGTYWSFTDILNCPGGGLFGFDTESDKNRYDGLPGLGGLNTRMGRAADIEPKDGGQFGLAAHYMASAIDTELGAYFVNYHARNPILSLTRSPSPGASLWSGFPGTPAPTQFLWDYSAQNTKAFGLSASTVVAGWTLNGEASYTKDIPVQINGVDLVAGAGLGAGPLASLAATPPGAIVRGYDLKNKTQLQVSTVKIFPRVAAAESLQLIGEVAYQHWAGIGDPNTSTRYGRAGVFGLAQTATMSCASAQNLNPDYCENKGFATSNSWGYRLLAELSYPNAFAGVNVKPRLFWSHDVKGYSADGTFVEDRQVLGLGARADYNNRYYADFTYTRYNRSAKYDTFHDRDYFSAVVGINF